MGALHQVIRRHLRDGGFRSRKLWFGVGVCLAILGLATLAAFRPLMGPVLETAVGGLIAVYAIFCGANIGGKFTIGAAVAKIQEPKAPAKASAALSEAPVEPGPE